jgi:threonine/homoserine efflux transporter RhtA
MLEVTEILVYAVVTTTLFLLLLRFDEARLSPDRLARAWTTTSKLAVVGCSLLGLSLFFYLGIVVHFGRTRRSFVGVAIGLLWAGAVFAVDIGVLSLLEWSWETAGLP